MAALLSLAWASALLNQLVIYEGVMEEDEDNLLMPGGMDEGRRSVEKRCLDMRLKCLEGVSMYTGSGVRIKRRRILKDHLYTAYSQFRRPHGEHNILSQNTGGS